MADPFSIESWRGVFHKHGNKIGMVLVVVIGLPMVVTYGSSFFHGNPGAAEASKAANTVVARVNGEPVTEGEFRETLGSATRSNPSAPGDDFAALQGQVLDNLATVNVLRQEAKRLGVQVSDADVDRVMQDARDQLVGKKGTDNEFADALYQSRQMSVSDFRESLRNQPSLLVMALTEHFKKQARVTEQDAKNQSAQVKLQMVLIPTKAGMMQPLPKGITPQPEALAKSKAEELLGKAKSGGDLAALAKANSGDASAAKGGDTGFLSEFREMSPTFGALGYGRDFDKAVQAAKNGEFTPVVKVSGKGTGYAFAKVLERKNDLPKDFKPAEVMEQMRTARASEMLQETLRGKVKAAKIEFSDPDKKLFYDINKLRTMEQAKMMAQFGQSDPNEDTPTEEGLKTKQTEVDAQTEAYYKRHPEDTTAALLMATLVNRREGAEKDPAKKKELQKQLIGLYETALKGTEKRDLRFRLAELYRGQGDNKKAVEAYDYIGRLLNAAPGVTVSTIQEEIDARTRMESGYLALGVKEQADKQKTLLAELRTRLAQEKKREEEARKAAAPPTGAPLGTVTVPPGGVGTPSPQPVAPSGGSAKPPQGGK